MEAGRELDALIAEKVMGQDTRWLEVLHGEHRLVWFKQNWGYGDDVPHYSTRIQDAWLVVEKMTGDGFCPALIFDDNGSWVMAFDGIQNLPEDDDPLITSFCIESKMIADTAPLAICLAALKAVEDKS